MVQATQGLDRFGQRMLRNPYVLCGLYCFESNDMRGGYVYPNGGVPARPYIGRGSRVTRKVLGRFNS